MFSAIVVFRLVCRGIPFGIASVLLVAKGQFARPQKILDQLVPVDSRHVLRPVGQFTAGWL